MLLTKVMKRDAAREATTQLFSTKVQQLEGFIVSNMQTYMQQHPDNAQIIHEYAALSPELKKLVRTSSSGNLEFTNNERTETIYVGITPHSEALGTPKEAFYPFDDETMTRQYRQQVNIGINRPFQRTNFCFGSRNEIPEFIKKFTVDRKALMKEIEDFMSLAFDSLASIKNVKALKELMPDFVKYFDLPSQNTDMVPAEMYEKIGKLLRGEE